MAYNAEFLEDLQAMYQLSPTPNFEYNAEFLEDFKEK
jgi:hypothetical protein